MKHHNHFVGTCLFSLAFFFCFKYAGYISKYKSASQKYVLWFYKVLKQVISWIVSSWTNSCCWMHKMYYSWLTLQAAFISSFFFGFFSHLKDYGVLAMMLGNKKHFTYITYEILVTCIYCKHMLNLFTAPLIFPSKWL